MNDIIVANTDTATPVTKKSQPPMTLLNLLRRQLVGSDHHDAADALYKTKLIVQHKSEFPVLLQEAIDYCLERSQQFKVVTKTKCMPARFFLSDLYDCVKNFFFGRWLPGCFSGLDDKQDTRDQAELVIRLFPKLLRERQAANTPFFRESGGHRCHPILALMASSRTMTFVPLLAKLGHELGVFDDRDRGGLACLMRNASVFSHLVSNRYSRDERESADGGNLDATSTEVLRELRDSGLIRKEDICEYHLVNHLLYRARHEDSAAIRFDQRLAFLIDWDPTLLKDHHVLHHFVWAIHRFGTKITPEKAIHDHHQSTIKGLEVLVEKGMLYYPSELGFLFCSPTLQLACDKFGPDRINCLARRELSKLLHGKANESRNSKQNPSLTLRTLLVDVATNDSVTLDGVYAVLRHDPIALLPQL